LGSHSGQDSRWLDQQTAVEDLASGFLPGEKRAEYLSGDPSNDSRFIGVFAHELEHSGGYTSEDAKAVAKTLLPDILFL